MNERWFPENDETYFFTVEKPWRQHNGNTFEGSSCDHQLQSNSSLDSGCSGSTSGGLEKSAVARLAQAGALLTAASWASSWDRDVLGSALSTSLQGSSAAAVAKTTENTWLKAGQPSATPSQSSQGGECMKTSATIEDFRNGESNKTFHQTAKGAKAVTVKTQEDNNPVLW